jgi:hypothetical protein
MVDGLHAKWQKKLPSSIDKSIIFRYGKVKKKKEKLQVLYGYLA